MKRASLSLVELDGVRSDTAALLIVAGDNPERLRREASFANLCGTASVPASSGKMIRYRLLHPSTNIGASKSGAGRCRDTGARGRAGRRRSARLRPDRSGHLGPPEAAGGVRRSWPRSSGAGAASPARSGRWSVHLPRRSGPAPALGARSPPLARAFACAPTTPAHPPRGRRPSRSHPVRAPRRLRPDSDTLRRGPQRRKARTLCSRRRRPCRERAGSCPPRRD